MVSVDAPRVRVLTRLPQALCATAAQSTPAVLPEAPVLAGDTMACSKRGRQVWSSGTQGRRRTVMSTRNVCSGWPWRSSSVRSDTGWAAFTCSKLGSACAAVQAASSSAAATRFTA
jgi:hypothetical protein